MQFSLGELLLNNPLFCISTCPTSLPSVFLRKYFPCSLRGILKFSILVSSFQFYACQSPTTIMNIISRNKEFLFPNLVLYRSCYYVLKPLYHNENGTTKTSLYISPEMEGRIMDIWVCYIDTMKIEEGRSEMERDGRESIIHHQPFGVRARSFAGGDGIPSFVKIAMSSSSISPFPDTEEVVESPSFPFVSDPGGGPSPSRQLITA